MTETEFLEKFHITLDEEQRAAMRIAGRHALLLAVPGSGKTAVIAARTGYLLLCRNIPAREILTITFSRAAAAEMRRRFAETFELPPAETPEFRTIHSLCRSILKMHCRAEGSALPELLPERRSVLRALYLALFPDAEYPDDALLRAIDMRITYAKNMLLTREQIAAIDLETVDFQALYQAYEAENRARGRMDFDDQLLMAYRLLRREPELLAALRARFRYVNVDEAQDTSYVQHRIIYLLAKPGELFMVGDEDQSIYGFRAAYPDIFLRFTEIYPGAALLRMETNYRSSSVITSAAERFIRRNKRRNEKRMRAARPEGAAIRVTEFLHKRAQYAYLVRQLAALPPGQTAAVLYRNNESVLPLLEPLAEAGIAFEARGDRAAEFFSCARVRHALGVLHFALHPESESAFVQVYHRLGVYASRAECEAVLAARAKGDNRPPLEVLATLSAGTRREQRVRERISELRAIARLSTPLAVREAWHVANGTPDSADDRQKLDVLSALGERCKTPSALLDCAERLSAWEGKPAPGACVSLSTIHAAKGREFNRVYLIDLQEGILPAEAEEDTWRPGGEDAEEEEARLFYVGGTRARDELELVCASRGYCGPLTPSPFIRALTARLNGKRIAPGR